MRIFSALYVLLLILSSCFTYAQKISSVQRLSPSEGLAQSYVPNLMVDKKGYLWIATEGGLNTYDGHEISDVLGPNNLLSDAPIDLLYQDSYGYIWIASINVGLFRYDPTNHEFKHVLKKIKKTETSYEHEIVSMHESTQEGIYWLGRIKDIALLNANTSEVTSVFTFPNSQEASGVRVLKQIGQYLFIGTTEGAYVMDTKTHRVIPFAHTPEKPHHRDQMNVKSFRADGDSLWVGAVLGLYRVDISEIRTLLAGELDSLPSEVVIPDLNIWKINKQRDVLRLATNQGIFDYFFKEDQLVKNTQIANSGFELADTSIIDMIEDEHGAMWVATKTDGAFYLPDRPYRFTNFNADNTRGDGLSHINVWTIKEYQGEVWAGTSDGLTRLNMATYESKVYFQGYMSDEFTSQFVIVNIVDYQGKLYLLTSKGLFQFNPATEELQKVAQSNTQDNDLLADFVNGGYIDNEGVMYLHDARNGAFTLDLNTRITSQVDLSSIRLDPLYMLGFFEPLSDKPNAPLFIHKGHVYRLINKKNVELIFRVQDDNLRETAILQAHAVDNNNVLWLSFSGAGLYGVDAETFQVLHHINTRDMAVGTLLYGFEVDEQGYIWMSSHKGIWRFDSKNLHFQQFTVDDGLYTNEFNAYSVERLQDGRIVYGSIKGLTAFSPESFMRNIPLISQVNITSLKLMSRQIEFDELQKNNSLILEHDDIGLEIGFSAMAFKYQDRIVFEYQLDDGKTIQTWENKVSFAKLQPGSHTFKVRARDPLTGTLTSSSEFAIQVKYPPWRSPAYYAIYAILLIMLISFWFYRRYKFQHQLLMAHNEAKRSEARLKMALEGSNSGVWEWQLEHGYIYQPRLVDELGYDSAQVTLDFYLSKLHPEDKSRFRIEWLEFLSTERGFFEASYRVRHANGHWRWYKDFGKVISWHDGLPEQVAGTYTNTTRERVLESNARLFGSAFEHTRDWVLMLNPNFELVAVNQALRDAFDYSDDILSARRLKMGLSAAQRGSYLRILSKLKAGDYYQSEESFVTRSKQHACIVKTTAVAQDNGQIENYVIVITDISAQKVAEEELRLLANYDPLTQLPNRSLLSDRIEHATELSRRHKSKLALLFIDLDKFKKINDSVGREIADKLLISVANRVGGCLREQDTVARLVGDEFTVMIEDLTHVDEVALIAEKILHEIALPLQLDQQTVSVTASIGIAVFPEDANNGANLLKAADIAMFHAKKRGGANFQFFRQDMNHKVQRLLQLESELKHAQMNNELFNHYQPIVCSTSGKLKGFETLLRWQKENELVSPGVFIPVAESTGLITSMTLATLERALSDLATWHLFFPECYVSINLSAKDFEHTDIATRIIDACARHRVSCEYLVLELTESTLMSDTNLALNLMQELKDAGCRLYVDDFGTGYSSLTYVKRFPIDVIKIDQSFVRDIGVDENDEAIIHSTLALAHSLGKSCVAEGVETTAQADFLAMLGCEYLQGYLYGKPMTKDKALEYIKDATK